MEFCPKTLPRFSVTKGLRCLVTGGSGFVGQRLVEMLVERGATRVISFDIAFMMNDTFKMNDDMAGSFF